MNKSLVLVMCDVLVLSAMSLSTGRFDDNLNSRRLNRNPYPHVEVKQDSKSHVKEQLEWLEKELARASNALERTSSSLTVATNKLVTYNADILSLSNRVAGVQQTLSQRESQIANLSDKLAFKDKDIAALSNRVAGVQQTLSQREKQIANLSDKLAFKDKDIAALSNRVAGVQQTLSQREKQIANLTGTITLKDENITTLNKGITALSNRVADVHQRLDNPLFEKERQIKQINDCSYAIYIQKDNEKAGKAYYSPLISIESNLYFIVYMPRKEIKLLNNHPITVFDRSDSVNRAGFIKSIWGLSEKYDTKQEGQDILFLQVKFLTGHRHAKPLRLGIISESPASYFYQFKSSSGGGDANSARILSADLFDMVNGYQNIAPGDLLISDLAISQGRATVVAIAQSNWGILKREFRFTNKVSRQELELLKD